MTEIFSLTFLFILWGITLILSLDNDTKKHIGYGIIHFILSIPLCIELSSLFTNLIYLIPISFIIILFSLYTLAINIFDD